LHITFDIENNLIKRYLILLEKLLRIKGIYLTSELNPLCKSVPNQ